MNLTTLMYDNHVSESFILMYNAASEGVDANLFGPVVS